MGKISEGVYMISTLESLTAEHGCTEAEKFVHDAKRFLLCSRIGIEQAPLQTYCSALVFAPLSSIVKEQFSNCLPRWVKKLPKVELEWNALVQILEGRSGSVKVVAFSDELLASASFDKTIKLWEPTSGALLQTLQGHSHAVVAISFLDGLLVSANEYGTIKLWDPGSGRLLKSTTMNPDSHICESVAFSAQLFVSGPRTDRMELLTWDWHSGTLCRTLERRFSRIDRFGKLILSSAGIIALSIWYTVELWDSGTGALLRTHKLKTRWASDLRSLTGLAFSPDGKLFAMAHETIVLSNVESGETLRTFYSHGDLVRVIAFSLDGKFLASASRDCTIKLWDLISGAELASLYDVSISNVRDIAFSNNGKTLASANDNGNVQLWDLSLRPQQTQEVEAHSDDINIAVLSPNGKLFCSSSLDCSIKIWSTTSGAVLQTLEGHSTWAYELSISPDGNLVASVADETIKIWDLRSGSLLRILIGHTSPIAHLAFSPDGKLVTSGSLKGDCTIKLWNTSSWLLQQTLSGHPSIISALVFSPDGTTVASAAFQTVKMWTTSSGVPLWTLEDHSAYSFSIIFAPNGKLVAIQDYHKSVKHPVKILDTTSGRLVQSIELPDMKCKIAFSEDGSTIIANGEPFYIIASNWTSSSIPKPAPPLDVRRGWVWWGTERILWLPPEYRPLQTLFYVHENILALCLPSRRVVFIEFAFEELYRSLDL